jgi:hypothetical protein
MNYPVSAVAATRINSPSAHGTRETTDAGDT